MNEGPPAASNYRRPLVLVLYRGRSDVAGRGRGSKPARRSGRESPQAVRIALSHAPYPRAPLAVVHLLGVKVVM